MDKKRKRSISRGIILALLAVAIGYTVYTTFTKDKVDVLKVGAEAPDFELVDLNGKVHRLSDYKGQGVLLNFWGTWCDPCKREFPAIERQYKSFESQGVHVLALNIAQSDFEVKNYVKNMGMTFPVAIDQTKSVMEAYNVTNLPATILINKEGKIEKIVTGEMTEAQIAAHMESIKPE
ncbi:thiol-disulfide oxidoreductase ResA [Lysinibacillus odysseyi]|uniref:Thiol-disulfide oxidoreductase n=1 Tax=Lysinibacillus odysseyi 34hs-1 = NBRC 100172 TaxID=1220589 RepID=A0A0A3IJF2_9BACI|nr:thiol-disulfide oxidoreductase ResA [Lysinibacillus odysseyi]KGR84871.1 thiol-disulfide oxidoreductase [Lysinibacillus odysseyi 34hs-1 = NBRC 100172]